MAAGLVWVAWVVVFGVLLACCRLQFVCGWCAHCRLVEGVGFCILCGMDSVLDLWIV